MTAKFTEDMVLERGAALVRIRKMERSEEDRLRKDMDRSIFREWLFWLALIIGPLNANNDTEKPFAGRMMASFACFAIAVDSAARKRAKALRDWEMLKKNNETKLGTASCIDSSHHSS